MIEKTLWYTLIVVFAAAAAALIGYGIWGAL